VQVTSALFRKANGDSNRRMARVLQIVGRSHGSKGVSHKRVCTAARV
jgi:hypothetical protein